MRCVTAAMSTPALVLNNTVTMRDGVQAPIVLPR
jgi:hypothetical protein